MAGSFFLPEKDHETISAHQVGTWRLSPDAFFNYLSYLELKTALEAAEKAQRNATIAIRISIASLLLTAISIIAGTAIGLG